jgi:hypothetical protein
MFARSPTWCSRATLIAGGLCVACPGTLEEPERFDYHTECELDVVQDVLLPSCGSDGCHAGEEPAAQFDVERPELETWLLRRPADSCGHRLLLDPLHPERSYLLEVLTRAEPECSSPMPQSGSLEPEQLACVEQWVMEMASRGKASDGVRR